MSRTGLPAEPAGDRGHAAVQAWTQVHGETAEHKQQYTTKIRHLRDISKVHICRISNFRVLECKLQVVKGIVTCK